MNTILITRPDKQRLYSHLLQNPNQENMAVTFCGINKSMQKLQLLVKDVLLLQNNDLVLHTRTGLELNKNVYRQILLKAEKQDLSIIIWHSHPFSNNAEFSSIDNSNDINQGKFIKQSLPNIYYGNVVVAQQDYKARLFNTGIENFVQISEVEIVGKPKLGNTSLDSSKFDRNYRAFGKQGQSIISSNKVALVGCGGLGWQIGQQLIALGVGEILLIDPDLIEKSNLNRLPAALNSKVGVPKARELSRILKRMNPNVEVRYRISSVLERRIQRELRKYNIIIGAVDSENIRLELNNFSVKYHKCYLDAGSEIILENKKVKHAGGQITTYIPGITPCLCCNNLLNWRRISYETLSENAKADEIKGGYIRGISEPSASVVSINGIVASALVNEFISITTKLKPSIPYLFFDLMNSEKLMFPIQVERNPNCIVCGRDGLFGYGDIEKTVNRKKEFRIF